MNRLQAFWQIPLHKSKPDEGEEEDEAMSRRWDPFKADVVLATLPFISSGLGDSSINNLMTGCFWECDRWSQPERVHTHMRTHTHTHTHYNFDDVRLSCLTSLLLYFSLSPCRFCGELIKTVKTFLQTQTHTHTHNRAHGWEQTYFLNEILFMTLCWWYSLSFHGNRPCPPKCTLRKKLAQDIVRNLKWLLVMLCHEGLIAGGPEEMYCFPSAILCFIKTIFFKKTQQLLVCEHKMTTGSIVTP